MSSHFVPAVGALQHLLLRWLLMSLDRLDLDELTMTHEMLANTLGVRREGMSESAYKSQSAGSLPTGEAVSRFSIASALNAYCPA